MSAFIATPGLLRFRRTRPALKHCSQRQLVCKTPPPVKPTFYKNPSKAIEKGGGFFIPGLRGERLRFFVFAVSGSLLFLNHITATDAPTSFHTSELIAVLAGLTVGITAFVDNRQAVELEKQSEADSEAQSPLEQAILDESGSGLSRWAIQVVLDLTSVTHIAYFVDGKVQVCTPNILDAPPGAAVERVEKEQKAVYIADSTQLPPEVTFPFLGDEQWSVYLVPHAQGVVVYAGGTMKERLWLNAFTRCIGSSTSVQMG